MKTIVYSIDNTGKTSELVTFALNPIDAIKSTYIKLIKKYLHTFKYSNIKLDIKETENGYYFSFNDGQLFTLKENIKENIHNEHCIN